MLAVPVEFINKTDNLDLLLVRTVHESFVYMINNVFITITGRAVHFWPLLLGVILCNQQDVCASVYMTLSEVQNRAISGPTKWILVEQKFI